MKKLNYPHAVCPWCKKPQRVRDNGWMQVGRHYYLGVRCEGSETVVSEEEITRPIDKLSSDTL